MTNGPNLAMWMWIATAHQLPVVFEDLHVLNIRTLPAVCEFTNPAIHHAGNFSF